MPKLTDLQIRNLKAPQDGQRLKTFYDGFSVRISKRAKTFTYWYSHQGRKRLLTLGRYPDMSLKEAMAAHARARSEHLRGADPAATKQDAIAASDRAPTVQKLVDEFAKHVLAKQPSGSNTLRQIEKDILPRLGPRTQLDSLRRRDAVVIVDAVRARGPRIGNSAAAILARLGNFAVERGLLDANPFASLKKVRIDPKTRVLADWELTRLVDHIREADLHPLMQMALLAILITGQRPGEVVTMRKDEISDGVWTIPATRYKTGVDHAVPLSALALDLVAGAAAHNAQSPFVFPSPRSPDRPIARLSLSRAILRKQSDELGIAPFTPHDLRRTCRTGMAALGVPDPVAEKVIGHKLAGMLAVYNVHPYMDEKRDALNRWAAHIERVMATPPSGPAGDAP